MADLTRADELVREIERDAAFQKELEAAPTAVAKRQVIDARGYKDIQLYDMKAYVESKGGTLRLQQGGRELTEQELAAVSGGLTEGEKWGIAVGVAVPVAAASAAAVI